MDEDPVPLQELGAQLRDKFKNFDDPQNYKELKEKAVQEGTKNFVVQFGANKAQIAIDLNEKELEQFLDGKKNKEMPIRWINLWDPSAQQRCMETIGHHYGFSTRLQATIATWGVARKQAQAEAAIKRQKSENEKVPVRPAKDPEEGLNGTVEKAKAMPRGFCPEDMGMFRLVQGTLNYFTIDHASRFMCIGANWLHERPNIHPHVSRHRKPALDLVRPNHWSWTALTNDSTVISFHEAPKYTIPDGVDQAQWRREELKKMRSNTIDLLSQLSEVGLVEYKTKIMASKAVRMDLKQREPHVGRHRAPTAMPDAPIEVEGSSNLFYYLFEDYASGVSILNQSREILADLTSQVTHINDRKNKDKDNSGIIKKLYDLNKELRQLRHLFESYEVLIKKIVALGIESSENMTASNHTLQLTTREVKLSQSAFDRFERLMDRLQILMLNTITEYLDEKNSLSNTYFNLIAQKDSQATARLTRSATLLAKLSVLFLPITFMTSYFSVSIPDLTDHYTARTYWIAFAVIGSLSIISLFFFSRVIVTVSDILDEYVKVVEEWWIRKILRKKQKKEEKDD